MSFHRRKTRPDGTQAAIVEALRAVGVQCWIIGMPCDLLTYYAPYKRWRPLECKPLKRNSSNEKKQVDQREFINTYGVPIVKTPQEAIEAVTRA